VSPDTVAAQHGPIGEQQFRTLGIDTAVHAEFVRLDGGQIDRPRPPVIVQEDYRSLPNRRVRSQR
jgi:hypothetical protein